MKKDKDNSIFAIFDDMASENLLDFVANFAQTMSLNLVLYFENKNTKTDAIVNSASDKYKIKIKIVVEKANTFFWFKSLCDIAKKENAYMIILNIKQENKEQFSSTIWDKAEKSNIPILFLPNEIDNIDIKSISIAADLSLKVQKTNLVSEIAYNFLSKIHIAIEVFEDPRKTGKTKIIARNIEKKLVKSSISFVEVEIEERSFLYDFCNYAKRTDLLVIEVDPGNIDKKVKENIQIFLLHKKMAILYKTQHVGLFGRFNWKVLLN